MYILKNAFKSIVRAKGRNLLIGLIVLVLSVSSCIGLSIKRSNTTLKNQYAEDREITATLTSTERGKAMEGIPLETLENHAENPLVKSFSYSASLYFSAGDGIEPLDVSGSFGQNRDFRDKYGDIENGEKITSSTSSSTTSTESVTEEDTADEEDGTVINLSHTNAGSVLNLVNDGEGNEPQDTPAQQNQPTEEPTVSSETENTSSVESSSQSATSSATESNNSQTDGDTGNPTQESVSSRPSDSAPNNGEQQSPQMPQGDTDNNTERVENGITENQKDTEKNNTNQNDLTDDTQTFPAMPQNPQGGTENSATPPSGGNFPGGNTFITNNQIINNQFFFNMASMNDFTVVGYNSTDAMPSYVSSLDVLDLEDSARNCVISKALADENKLEIGDSFKLTNPNNDEESYKFTIVGICDTSESTDTADTSSNASYTDNYIHISSAAIEKIVATSEKKNADNEDSDSENSEEKSPVLSPIYSGTYSFKNLTDYNSMNELVSADSYSLVSEDVENYEQSIEQLETLGGYATYFLIVIFIIGAIVLVIINLFSIRDRKYEIGVLTAIGMKKHKVATQFVIELFCITFSALIIGSCIGAVSSVPITNGLLTTINTTSAEASEDSSVVANPFEDGGQMTPPDITDGNTPPEMPNDAMGGKGGMGGRFQGFMQNTNNYIASVTSATDLTVIGQMILVGLGLTLISALSAVLFVMRYEPLKILSNRE